LGLAVIGGEDLVNGMRLAGITRLRVVPDVLPDSLAPLQSGREGDSQILQLPDYHALERMLGLLREAGLEVQDLEVMQADLEEVFVQMMRKA
jgi:ABC-2 type transport system ATP-binding protein